MRYAIFALLLLAAPAFSGEPVYEWRTRTDDPDRVYLYRDGAQIGGWCYRTKRYRSYDGENWGQPTKISPVQPPQRKPATTAPVITMQSQPLYGGPLRRRVQAGVNSTLETVVTRFIIGPSLEAMGKALTEAARELQMGPKP